MEKRFADLQIDAVYASDLYRARATASSIYKPKNLIVCQRQDLREICLGAWEGLNWGNIAYEEPTPFGNFNTALDQWYVHGAEKPEQALDRIVNAIRQIAAEHDGKSVAVDRSGGDGGKSTGSRSPEHSTTKEKPVPAVLSGLRIHFCGECSGWSGDF
jgi:probable phosphoglycerate mutase